MKPPILASGQLDAPAAEEGLREFLKLFLTTSHINVQYEIKTLAVATAHEEEDAPIMEVNFHGPDENLLLERHGELLQAMEHIAVRWLRLPPQLHSAIAFDCADFRASRIAELQLSARVAADRVRESGQPFPLQAMDSRERRIIHLELNGAQGIRTESEGRGSERHVVIYPQK